MGGRAIRKRIGKQINTAYGFCVANKKPNRYYRYMRRNSGFTLIELLVVVTIIGILAGLAFPAITGALNAAKKAEANVMINQLKTALSSYQTEYGVWPSMFTGPDALIDSSNPDLYLILTGFDTSSNDNPRQISFMDFNSKILRAGAPAATNRTPPADLTPANAFADPWNGLYYIQVDSDYNNRVVIDPTNGSGDTINSSIAIWSNGKDSVHQTKDPKSW